MAPRSPLDDIRVAAPCSARWNDMTGDNFCRHCALCDKDVYDLSALPADDALRLIREREGNICARFYRRPDGTVLTADCPEGLRSRRRGRLVAAGFAGILSLAGTVVGVEMVSGPVVETRTAVGGGESRPSRALRKVREAAHRIAIALGLRSAPVPVVMGEIYIPDELLDPPETTPEASHD